MREIHETHYSELISHTSYSPYSFPQHADIPTSSTAVNMPTPSTAVNMPTPSTALYIPTSSIVADIPTDPTSSIVTTFAETETGVELIERTKPTLTHLIDQFLYHCACHSLMKIHQMFPIPNFIRANVLYVRKNAVQGNVAQDANNQSILTVINLSRELKIQSVRYGALVVGSMLGLNHCKKAVYQLREGRINK